MKYIADFFSVSVIAILFQNVVFSRALGTGRLLKITDDKTLIAPYSVIITGTLLLSSALAWAIGLIGIPIQIWHALEPLIYIGCISVVLLLAILIWKKYYKNLYQKFYGILIPASLNFTVLGTILLGAREKYSLIQFLGLAFGSGIGFTLAAIVVYYGKKHLSQLNVPESFKGLPSQLIYIGILSLAIYGFIGKSILL